MAVFRRSSLMLYSSLRTLNTRRTQITTRVFSTTSNRFSEIQKTSPEVQKPPPAMEPPDLNHTHTPHAPSPFDKQMLVWAGMYPSKEAVPETVSYTKMKKARDLTRVRINLYMIFTTAVTCAVIMYFGRKARNAGDGLTSRGMAHQRQLREQGKREQAEAEAQKQEANR